MNKPTYRVRAVLLIIFFACLIQSCGENKKANSGDTLPVSTPEAEGVSSAGILEFIDALDKGKNEIHSVVIVRHGKIIAEGWWSPYGKDLKHVMFSVSKSFTSIGVGLAIAENKLKLTDKVASFFPESLSDTASIYMKEMTVQDLLKMSTGMNADPLFTARGSADWPGAFLASTVESEPGTVFKYNNMASFMLSAIVQKATGEKLFDYLKPRLFEPLSISNVSWDEALGGYTFGAIGLKLQSEDMAKFGQMLLQKGKWNGKQIVPEGWVEEATSFQLESNDPSNKNPKELNDWAQGYGYQFWRGRNNSYRADGLGGQFIIVLPEKDAVVVLTSSAINTQEELSLVWDKLLPAMQDKPLPQNKKALADLEKRIASLSVSKTSSADSNSSALLTRISGKKIEVGQNEIGVQALSLSVKNGDVLLQIDRGEKYEIVAGLDRWKFGQTQLNNLMAAPRQTQALPIKVASKYSWVDPTTLEFTSKFVEESIGSESWFFRFEENGTALKVRVEIKGMPEGMPFARPPVILEGSIIN